MSYFKPIFILYLIISSFTFTICSKIKYDNKEKKILDQLVETIQEIYKTTKKNVINSGIAYLATIIKKLLNIALSFIGNGISNAFSYMYSHIYDLIGSRPGVTSWFIVGSFVVVIIGGCYVIYKVVNSNHFVKVKIGDIEVEYGYNATNY